MRKNKRKNTIFLLILLIVGVTIGFAALATTLKINGIAIINKSSWNIYWDNIDNQKGVTPTTSEIVDEDSTHKKNIVNFAVTFHEPGQFYEFTVDAVNAGTLDAEIINIEKRYNDTVIPENPTQANPSPLPSYIKYEVTYADGTKPELGNKLLKAADLTSTPPVYTRKTYKIRVEYDKEAVTIDDINNQTGNVNHTFSFEVTYDQSTSSESGGGDSGNRSFATDAWSVIAVDGPAAAQQTSTNGACGSYYHVGDTKTVDLGSLGTHTVRIANCSTPAVCSTSGFSQTACGFVIEFTDVVTKIEYNDYYYDVTGLGAGNRGGWEYSKVRAYLRNGTYTANGNSTLYTSSGLLSKLPSDLRSVLATTTVVSSGGSEDSQTITTTDSLYLLATHEVWEDALEKDPGYRMSDFDTAYNNTRQLDYYKNLGLTTTANYAAAAKTGESTFWWLRSASHNNNFDVFMVPPTGMWAVSNPDWEAGVSPAFKVTAN